MMDLIVKDMQIVRINSIIKMVEHDDCVIWSIDCIDKYPECIGIGSGPGPDDCGFGLYLDSGSPSWAERQHMPPTEIRVKGFKYGWVLHVNRCGRYDMLVVAVDPGVSKGIDWIGQPASHAQEPDQ